MISRWWHRPAISLWIAAVGYGLTFWAWSLTGPVGLVPQLWTGGYSGGAGVAVVTTLVVGSLGRVPVGVLADRYGARLVLPVIGVATAIAVLLLAAVGPGPAVLAVCVPLGIGGTTFAVGAAVVIRSYPPQLRAVRMSVFGAGMGLASATGVVCQIWVTVDPRTTLPLLAVCLVGYSVVGAAVLRDRPRRHGRADAHSGRVVADMLRLPVVRHLSGWYAVSFGGLVACGVYLPAYLHHAYGLSAREAVLYTAASAGLAAACRPVGGWVYRPHDPTLVLRIAFTAAGGAVLVLALHPQPPVAAGLIAVVAAGLGAASGSVQALIGATAPAGRAGTVAGTVGAIGGLAGVLPPLLLAVTYGVSGTYSTGLTVLAALALANATHLHRHSGSIAAQLAFPSIGTSDLTTTVVLVPPAGRDGGGLARTVTTLADLAVRHELVAVAADSDPGPLVDGLRTHLPRHRIVGIAVSPTPHPDELALITELLDDGALPVAVAASGDPATAARRLAAALGQGQVQPLAQEVAP